MTSTVILVALAVIAVAAIVAALRWLLARDVVRDQDGSEIRHAGD